MGNGVLFHRGPRSVEGGEGGEGGAQSLEDAETARGYDEEGESTEARCSGSCRIHG